MSRIARILLVLLESLSYDSNRSTPARLARPDSPAMMADLQPVRAFIINETRQIAQETRQLRRGWPRDA
jgi:hypothetical protein